MLKSFSLENYRSFVDPATIDLRPITLLFGYNHSGKSALLRFLPLLAESATGRYPGPLALQSPPARGASFDDLCSRQSERSSLSFTLSGDLTEPRTEQFSCRYELRSLPGTEHFIHAVESSWRAAADQPLTTFNAARRPEAMPGSRSMSLRHAQGDAVKSALAQFSFHGLTPFLRGPTAMAPWVWDDFQLHAAFLADLFDQVQWLGAIRRPPPRRVELIPGAALPAKIAPDGGGAAELLAADHGGELRRAVETWFGGEKGGQRFVLQTREDNVRLRLGPWAAPGVEVDLADCGEGMTQVLPVIVALARAERGAPDDPRIVACEQPELHLHPRKEIALARLLARIASTAAPPSLLLETHSENLLLALQLEIAEGRLDPARLGLYWIRQYEDGTSRAEPLAIDADARIKGWPRGVFEEDSTLARELAEARMRRADR